MLIRYGDRGQRLMLGTRTRCRSGARLLVRNQLKLKQVQAGQEAQTSKADPGMASSKQG